MNPQALQLALFLLEEGIKLEPAIAEEVRALLNKNDPTPEDWAALRSKVAGKTYSSYVPASALTAGVVTDSPPAPAPEPVFMKADPSAAPAPEPTPTAAAPAVAVFTGQAVDPHA